MSYVLSCCSTADLKKQNFTKKDINYICFHYYLDGEHYFDDLGQTMPFDEFYAKMAKGAETSTSQINAEEFTEYFERFLKDGKDILHLCLSSGISGVYNSAEIAANELAKKYSERKIYVVDSLGASSGYGLLMDTLADMRADGKSIDELKTAAEDMRLKLHHWFFSTDLTFYVKGGRVSKVSGWFGTKLKICPLLDMNNAGRLIPRKKVRGKNNVSEKMVDMMQMHAEGGLDYSGKCFISHSACMDDALKIARMVEERFKSLNGSVQIFDIGTTIGSHTGPGTVALFFFGDERGE